MDKIKIKVEKRSGIGKQKAKRLRSEGFIPAVVYSKEINIPVSIPSEAFKVLKKMHFSESSVINLTIDGQKESEAIPVLVKDVQFHPLTDEVIHLDLLKVSLKEKIKVNIPVILKGEAKGKEEGAVLEQILREIEVEGLPMKIPEKFSVDISELEIGHSLHVKDLPAPADVVIITEPEATIVALVVKKEEEEDEGEVAEEEVSAEPEVIKEKKTEGESGEEGQEKKPREESDEKEKK